MKVNYLLLLVGRIVVREIIKNLGRAYFWKVGALSPRISTDDYLTPSSAVFVPQTPLSDFKYYFNDELWELFPSQTNLFHVQQTGKTLSVTVKEVKIPFSIDIMMGTLKFPQARMYCASSTHVDAIEGNMARDCFFKIQNMLHVADNPQDQTPNDTLWKVRPLLEEIRKASLLIPRSKVCFVDEQMILFIGHTEVH